MGVARARSVLDLLVIFEEWIIQEYYQLMISLEKLKEIEPKLAGKTDEEILKIRELLYGLAELTLESYTESKQQEK